VARPPKQKRPDAGGTHESAVIDAGASIGAGVRVWHFCHVMGGARIGPGAMLGQGCFVGSGVTIGARVRLQNHVSVFEGVEIEDDVFVGPSVAFTNVRAPRAFVARRARAAKGGDGSGGFETTRVRRGATIGANATIVCGTELGEYCLVGAGAVVTRDVPKHAVVAGVPARKLGWVSRHGEPLQFKAGRAVCPATGERYQLLRGAVTLLGESQVARRPRQARSRSSR
jgi:UDP-2-acetamido-3-amino-2,3-dideoxy-glucuronate N-acetyltransferase